ncbi:hypothetical protein K7432_014078 [Basidiobolus ranarum]|uniref:Uncharacterized protein n=1 Tax=Basidiobolus ranarum TaxID=34480 RepID=A0ABR2WI67_9FUNG
MLITWFPPRIMLQLSLGLLCWNVYSLALSTKEAEKVFNCTDSCVARSAMVYFNCVEGCFNMLPKKWKGHGYEYGYEYRGIPSVKVTRPTPTPNATRFKHMKVYFSPTKAIPSHTPPSKPQANQPYKDKKKSTISAQSPSEPTQLALASRPSQVIQNTEDLPSKKSTLVTNLQLNNDPLPTSPYDSKSATLASSTGFLFMVCCSLTIAYVMC